MAHDPYASAVEAAAKQRRRHTAARRGYAIRCGWRARGVAPALPLRVARADGTIGGPHLPIPHVPSAWEVAR